MRGADSHGQLVVRDAEPHLVPPDLEDRDDDVVGDHDALVGAAGEDEHATSPYAHDGFTNR